MSPLGCDVSLLVVLIKQLKQDPLKCGSLSLLSLGATLSNGTLFTPQLKILRCIKRYTIPWPISVVPFVHPDLVVNLRLCVHGWYFAALKESDIVAVLMSAAESTHPSIHLFQVHIWPECRHRHRGSIILSLVSSLSLYSQISTRQRHIRHLWQKARYLGVVVGGPRYIYAAFRP